MTVELRKNPTLGISITGGINGENLCHTGDPSLYVYNMADGKPAKMSGQIQIGDKILSVSGCMKMAFTTFLIQRFNLLLLQ